jgi:cell shape-determining protein MreC
MRIFLIIFSVVVLFSGVSFADSDGEKGKSIEQVKANILEKMDKKISTLNRFKSCVSSASSHDAIKTCRQQKKESMKAIKKENKKERKHFRDERKKRKGKRGKKDNDDDD